MLFHVIIKQPIPFALEFTQAADVENILGVSCCNVPLHSRRRLAYEWAMLALMFNLPLLLIHCIVFNVIRIQVVSFVKDPLFVVFSIGKLIELLFGFFNVFGFTPRITSRPTTLSLFLG
jgi:hypothetical protein